MEKVLTPDSALCRLLGGDKPLAGGAYLATACMGLAAVLGRQLE